MPLNCSMLEINVFYSAKRTPLFVYATNVNQLAFWTEKKRLCSFILLQCFALCFFPLHFRSAMMDGNFRTHVCNYGVVARTRIVCVKIVRATTKFFNIVLRLQFCRRLSSWNCGQEAVHIRDSWFFLHNFLMTITTDMYELQKKNK